MKSFKQFLLEMPEKLGLVDNKEKDYTFDSIRLYDEVKKNKKIDKVETTPDNDVTIHHKKTASEEEFSALDNKRKRLVFVAYSKRNSKNKHVPLPHNSISYIKRNKESTALPPHFGSNFVYKHLIINKKEPLLSDEKQFTEGHKMWGHLIDRSFKEGHHAYVIDKNVGQPTMTKITPENKESIMKKSYDYTTDEKNKYSKKRYLISKEPIEGNYK